MFESNAKVSFTMKKSKYFDFFIVNDTFALDSNIAV
jgi:hypothetical protein